MADIGRSVLEIAERLDQRADAALALGERLDDRAEELIKLGRRMEKLGKRVDKRGTEIVEAGDEIVASAGRLSETGSELIRALPALERAIEMASPLEGAIDRFGRLVDRLPGGTARRAVGQIEADGTEIIATPEPGSPEQSEQLGT
jgi:chromosome segregation ATPase